MTSVTDMYIQYEEANNVFTFYVISSNYKELSLHYVVSLKGWKKSSEYVSVNSPFVFIISCPHRQRRDFVYCFKFVLV